VLDSLPTTHPACGDVIHHTDGSVRPFIASLHVLVLRDIRCDVMLSLLGAENDSEANTAGPKRRERPVWGSLEGEVA